MIAQIESQIRQGIPDADVQVQANGPGHYILKVRSSEFAGKSRLAQQRMVLATIKDLMAGDYAPVHAIDTLMTEVK